MGSLLDRKLLVVSGKGGAGKSTVAAALGLAAAREGRRTLVVEVGEENRVPAMFGVPPPQPGTPRRLRELLWSVSLDPDRALLEWLQALGGRVSGRMLASSGTFQYFAAAAPGARELVTMMKVWRLACGEKRGEGQHDLVVLDAPATGHALGLLASPRTFGAIARVGPIAGHTRQVLELLESPARSAYLAVALPTEMAVTEALELQDGLERQLGRELAGVVVNAVLPRRFSAEEMRLIATLADAERGTVPRAGAAPATPASDEPTRQATVDSAVAAAHAVYERHRFQQGQLARLRRRSFGVVGLPYVWKPELDADALELLATRLARGIATLT